MVWGVSISPLSVKPTVIDIRGNLPCKIPAAPLRISTVLTMRLIFMRVIPSEANCSSMRLTSICVVPWESGIKPSPSSPAEKVITPFLSLHPLRKSSTSCRLLSRTYFSSSTKFFCSGSTARILRYFPPVASTNALTESPLYAPTSKYTSESPALKNGLLK